MNDTDPQPRQPKGSPLGGEFAAKPGGEEGPAIPVRTPAPSHASLDRQVAEYVVAAPPPPEGDQFAAWITDFVNNAARFDYRDYTPEYNAWAAAEAPFLEIDHSEDVDDDTAMVFALETEFIIARLHAHFHEGDQA